MYCNFLKGGGTALKRRASNPNRKTVGKLFSESVILSAIDRFLAAVYRSLQNGFFGQMMSRYPESTDDPCGTSVSDSHSRPGSFGRKILLPLRRTVSAETDESFLFACIRRLIAFLLRCRLRVYGTFLLTFGLYTAASYALSYLSDNASAPISNLIAALVMSLSAIPLFFSGASLSEALLSSKIAPPVCAFLGIRQSSLRAEGHSGRSNFAFVLGMFFGISSYFVPVLSILIGFFALLLFWRIFLMPELGVVFLFLLMPFLPTMALAGLLIYTAICYCVKLFLGKRKFSLETADKAALFFAFALLLSGLFSFSAGSLKPALLLVCFIGGYFLTVLLIRTEEWLARCSWAAIAAASVVSLYGIFQYLTGSLASADAWLDSDMFEDISLRVVSTLENPNMLAEYLILLFPLAACRLITRGSSANRTLALSASALIGVCLILTWSRGAWLGLLFSALIFLLIWHRRAMYLIFAGVISIPFLPLILPDSIISRFTSIGNLADTSTAYRVNIWHGAVRMLKDYWFCGIGVGESAWFTTYPRYSLAAIESAPHAHNLYLQTWIESGIVGLSLLLAFLFLLCQANFSFYRRLSDMRETIVNSISLSHLNTTARESQPIRKTIRRGGKDASAAEKEITVLRVAAAAPLCGLIAALLQGFTDYIWYNYRVFLMFWLVAGLSMAYVRRGQAELTHIKNVSAYTADSPGEAAAELPLLRQKSRNGKEKGDAPHV